MWLVFWLAPSISPYRSKNAISYRDLVCNWLLCNDDANDLKSGKQVGSAANSGRVYHVGQRVYHVGQRVYHVGQILQHPVALPGFLFDVKLLQSKTGTLMTLQNFQQLECEGFN